MLKFTERVSFAFKVASSPKLIVSFVSASLFFVALKAEYFPVTELRPL